MAGNGRFDMDSGTVEPGFMGSFANGPKGNHSGPTLDRSGSFREGCENRAFQSGNSTFRSTTQPAGSFPASLQGLNLDPITIGGLKSRSSELRRILNASGLASEEMSLGTAHSRPIPFAAVEELKRYKDTITEVNNKARHKVKKLNENLQTMNKIIEGQSSKKQQRNEPSSNERSSGSNLKIGAQIYRNSPVDDRAKNGIPNKRVRTSVAETQLESRSNGISRQSLTMAKGRDLLKDGTLQPDMAEEKIRRLPAGGESWDKKMKRKRSVSTVFTRSLDDGDHKRPMHQKSSNEGGSQGDFHAARSGYSNAYSGPPKTDSTPPVILNVSAMAKHEQEKASPRDLASGLNTDRLIAKGNNGIREENQMGNMSPVTKTKASRAPRGVPAASVNLSTNILRPGAPEICEQPSNLNKIHLPSGCNNRKRSMPSGSTSPSMAQWVGQRPQKSSRTRRANLVSPVSNPEDSQVSADGYSPSDFGARTNSIGLFRDGSNGKKHLKMKVENVTSPARFSEGEESVAGESKMKKKCTGVNDGEEKAGTVFPNVGMPTMFAKKNKSPREDISDCVRKQGRSGRGSPFSTSSSSPFREKMENTATAKPLRMSRPTCDKNGSKTGRPPKKLVDRKGSYRRHVPNGGSPDFTGESDDDRDELFASVSFASNPNLVGSNSFLKNVEAVFAPVNLQDTSYLTQQLQLAEELNKNLPQMIDRDSNCLDDPSIPATLVSGAVNTDGVKKNQTVKSIESVNWFNEFETPSERPASERRSNIITPLFQRVLSALIIEDEIEEFEEHGAEGNAWCQYSAHNLSFGNEPSKTEGRSGKFQLQFGTEMEKQTRPSLYFSYDGVNGSMGQNSPCNADKLQEGNGFSHNVGILTGLCKNSLSGSPFEHSNGFGNSSSIDEYEQLCIEDRLLLELQSIGVYPEIVPHLEDQDDTWIQKEITQLTKGYSQQVARKKASLNKISEAISQQKEAEKGALEQVAMDRLVELAYKKLLATKGSIASKSGIPKVSKNVALAFSKRTLARCRAFEDSGVSCFNETPFREVLFATPTPHDETEPPSTSGQRVASSGNHAEQHGPCGNKNGGSPNLLGTTYRQSDQVLSFGGTVSHRGKKREVLLDDVSGSAAFRSTSVLEGVLSAGAKGKRSEREATTPSGSAMMKYDQLSTCNGDRKTKTNPKLKPSMLSSPGNAFIINNNNKSTETAKAGYVAIRGKKDSVQSNLPQSSKVIEEEPLDLSNFPLPELDTIDELGAGTDLGGNQDLSSWFNFDVDGLHDQDLSMEGLEIPMDEIADLNMF